MSYSIAVLPGDGVGPEVTAQGVRVLETVGRVFGHTFHFTTHLVGAVALRTYDTAMQPETLEDCRRSDAILFGAVGDPTGDDARIIREALFPLRKTFDLFANLRSVKVYPPLIGGTTLKPEFLHGVDLIVVRELTGGLYFGKPKRQWRSLQGRQGVDTLRYSEREIRRVLQVGFELARQRRKKLTSVDKANVLETSRLWRQIALELAAEYPDVALEHMYVDNAAMQLVRRPAAFDVIVTENMFGDILTDEAAVLAGSMGMLPSASLGKRRRDGTAFGMYEPIHGTAPDIAGQDQANPLASILSAALLLRYSLGLEREAQAIERAVEQVLEAGYRTVDIADEGATILGTQAMGDKVAELVAAGG
ncbi:MAG: 3-isopropylmalate dehydrogenase [Chloroflexi bacterium]|nr:3-isopropylmalate dehydrogenase [Chloroflexota bacterium]